MLNKIGKRAKNLIEKRTREGYGVNEAGAKEKLAPLAPHSTIPERRRFSRLSSKTTPETSNLTRTGGMLRDLKVRLNEKTIEIYFNQDSSAKKEDYAREGSRNRPKRPFASLTTEEIDKLVKFYIQMINKG